MSNGWICLHRKMTKHWLWQDAERFRAWAAILMHVNHSAAKVLIKGELIELQPGQSAMSQTSWAKLFGWERKRVSRFFELLKSDSMITLKTSSVTTILSVCNWETYQGERPASGTDIAQHMGQTSPSTWDTNNNDKQGSTKNNTYASDPEDLFSPAPIEPKPKTLGIVPPLDISPRLHEVYLEIARENGQDIADKALSVARKLFCHPSPAQVMQTVNQAHQDGVMDQPASSWRDFRDVMAKQRLDQSTGNTYREPIDPSEYGTIIT